jgi:hypothetical protein
MSNAGADRQKKMVAVSAFVLVAVGVLYYEFRDPSPVTAPPVVTSAPAGAVPRPGTAVKVESSAKRVSGESSQLDPSLRMGPMLVAESLVYSGGGRNIFSVTSAPVDIPKVIAPARPKGPVVPVYVAPAGPPPPPPIDLKFFGTATSGNGTRQAFLLHGDDVFLALPGDIVQRRYRIISIAANSIVIEDMANNNTQTLPLLTN